MLKRKRRGNKSYHLPLNYSVTRAILDILLDFGENMPLQGSPWRRMKGIPRPPRWRLNRALAYLEKRGEIKQVERNNKIFLSLTREGKIRALMLSLYRGFEKKSDWDGKWRLIMWDIPEKFSEERNKIRRLVKDLEFYQLQKSVFVTPYPLPDSAIDYLRESELLNYIRLLRVERFENDKFLKKHFKLD